MIRVGLTGGIASGKSSVAALLIARGISVVDADDITHHLLAEDEAVRAGVREQFGDGVFLPDGLIDRPALGKIVFADTEKRQALEALIHPRVRQTIRDFFNAEAAKGTAMAVASVPLIFESELDRLDPPLFDHIVLVAAPEGDQIQRLKAYRNMSEADALARIRAQLPLAEKRQRAHSVIENEANAGALEAAVMRWLTVFLASSPAETVSDASASTTR